MIDEFQKTCQHDWVEKRVSAKGCFAPLAGSLEDLTGCFCCGGDPYTFNYSVIVRRCKKCSIFKVE